MALKAKSLNKLDNYSTSYGIIGDDSILIYPPLLSSSLETVLGLKKKDDDIIGNNDGYETASVVMKSEEPEAGNGGPSVEELGVPKPIKNENKCCSNNLRFCKMATLLKGLSLLGFHFYLGYAVYYQFYYNSDDPPKKTEFQWCDGLGLVIICTGLGYLGIGYSYFVRNTLRNSKTFLLLVSKLASCVQNKAVQILIYIMVILSVVIFLVLDTYNDRRRLISASGVIVLVLICTVASKHPKKINWRQVTWGLCLQFVFALLILRWSAGKAVFDCIGTKIDTFLGFTNQGSGFVFGYLVHQKIFNTAVLDNNSIAFNVTSEINSKKAVPGVVVFSALSVIYFFSFMVNILFHYGIVQWFTLKIGWILKITIGTSVVESMNAASNIFLGQAMAPLLIKPYLEHLTLSELHAVLTSGFSTIAGTVMAAYISFGVNPAHLLSASVMSAPAALAAAKLLLPETKKRPSSSLRSGGGGLDEEEANGGGGDDADRESFRLSPSHSGNQEDKNLLSAATSGAINAATLVLNITAIVIAVIAFVAFLDAVVAFLAGLVGFPQLTFQTILGYAFMPLAFIMGVEWAECHTVGTLIGIKTVANEFIAYRQLGILIEAQALSPRAALIATYALCGYANPGSMGVQLATLGSLCPTRRDDVSSVIFRAFVAGSVACFLTASIAGALVE